MFVFPKLPHKIHPSLPLLSIVSRIHTNIIQKPKPGDPPNFAAYDTIINDAGRHRDFQSVVSLIRSRWKEGGVNSEATFAFIRNTTRELHAVLRELFGAISHLYAGPCRKTAYDALVARLGRLNLVDESLLLADKVIYRGYGADARTFYPVLDALTRRRTKNVDRAWDVIRRMKDRGVAPDETAYGYLLKAYCLSGSLEAATGVAAAMEEDGVAAGRRTYQLLVWGACSHGKVEAALAVLRRVEDEGVVLPLERYAEVIKALVREGCYEQAMEFVMGCYAGKEKLLDELIFETLALGLVKAKKTGEAERVLQEMMKRNLPLCEKLQEFCSQMRWSAD